MNIEIRIAAVAALGLLASGTARAEHDHGGGNHHPAEAAAPGSMFTAGVGLVAARYDTDVYLGDYQGVVPAVAWIRGRFGASANLGMSRLTENGATRFGIADVAVSAQATLVEHGGAIFGVALPVSLPTGDHLTGFGMGHVMVMPAAWGSGAIGRVHVGASAGYSRAL